MPVSELKLPIFLCKPRVMYLVGRFGDTRIDIATDEPLVPNGHARVILPIVYNNVSMTVCVPQELYVQITEMVRSVGTGFDCYKVDRWNECISSVISRSSNIFVDWRVMHDIRTMCAGCTIYCKTIPSSYRIDYLRFITTYDQVVKDNFPILTRCDGDKYAFEMMTFYELMKRIVGYKCILIAMIEEYASVYILVKTDVSCSRKKVWLRYDTISDCIGEAKHVIASLPDIDDFIISPCLDTDKIGMKYPQIVVEFLSGFLTLSNAAMQQIYGDIEQIPATDYVYGSKSLQRAHISQ